MVLIQILIAMAKKTCVDEIKQNEVNECQKIDEDAFEIATRYTLNATQNNGDPSSTNESSNLHKII